MIMRDVHLAAVRGLLRQYPVVGILGARQVGKTTLALAAARGARLAARFDLEDPRDLARLQEPMAALEGLRGLVIIDEIQRRPELFPALRVLADRPRRPARFLILGSASPSLLRQSSESLAGRVGYHRMGGFDLLEVGPSRLDALWLRGGFPRSFLAPDEESSMRWRRNFLTDFLERELPQLGIRVPAATLRRFWTMLAHYHGQVWNSSEFARSFGVADTTVRHYLDIMTDTFMLSQLLPWHENLRKRQVKAPKLYLSDPGLLHILLDIHDKADLASHPKSGASWEGFALTQVMRRLGAAPSEAYFWATHTGAELDLLIVRGRRRRGFEFKKTGAPSLTPSMRIALTDLSLESLDVIYPGAECFPLAPKIRAVGLSRLRQHLEPLNHRRAA
ncbi:MAG: ATPase-like protein [Elusimicrobia bacterium]|nr:MAG: ATPase-like protein [Elusimicrobiota bacterium]